MVMRAEQGFTYLGVLFAIALMGTLFAITGESWHTASQREKERELLFVGDEFRDAIALYYTRTPGNAKRFPRSIEELLKDPRYLTTQRYLRKIYIDPMTKSTEWGLVKAPDGGIAGVFSLSEQAPMKIDGFHAENAGFEGAQKYSDWKFVYRPRAATARAPAPHTTPRPSPTPSPTPPGATPSPAPTPAVR